MSTLPTMLDECRKALRISGTTFDDEISTLIDAARLLMQARGVRANAAMDDTNQLVRVAIVAFVKGNFGLDNPDTERYDAAFQNLVTSLKLTQEYGKELS